MREIKFRAWFDTQKIMVDHDNLEIAYGHNEGFNQAWNYQTGDVTFNFELMQYTGLKDRNGKEIYEGDIVKGKRYVPNIRDHMRYIGEVVYVSPAFMLNGVGKSKGIIHEELHSAYEVIGNICENSELLEAK